MKITDLYGENGIAIAIEKNGISAIGFSECDLREIVKFLKKTHPRVLQEIMCEDCPEVC